MHPTLRFVPLSKELIPSILEIENVTHAAPWSEKSFENELQHSHGVFLVALIEGNVVAYGGTWVLIDEAHITNVVVRNEMRGQGLGRRLMIELLEAAKKKGALVSTLEVRASNKIAIKLYEDLGYFQATVRRGYYPDNKEDAIIMMLDRLDQWQAPKSKENA